MKISMAIVILITVALSGCASLKQASGGCQLTPEGLECEVLIPIPADPH
jgi:uncharacterized protein YceK